MINRNSAYQIGNLRDSCGGDADSSIFSLTLDVIQWAKNIKESYNSPSTSEIRFEDMSISSPIALSYAIWHSYSKLAPEATV